ncbi:MAG: sulfotransferase domain-containing protein [Novosphingobium sp.]|nr:sulfotransferase domain-containing protein [Novosphingobium sp.]
MPFPRRTPIDLAHLQATQDCPFNERYGMRVLFHDGIAWGPPTTVELVEAVKDFPLDRSDVLVTGFPKSGTNWVQIMLANMWDDWGSYRLTGSRRVPSIEFIGDGTDGYDIAVSSDPPRLMKNHLDAARMPRNWRESRAKVVYLTRNPFDVCPSFFRQLQLPWLDFDADWDKWVDRFIQGDTLYGGWANHVRSWHAHGPAGNVFHVSYEALTRDPFGEMRKVVDFLGKPLDDARFEDVVTNALRENMDASGFSEQITVRADHLDLYRGSGEAGRGREKFTPAQAERMERDVIEPLRAAGIPIEG